MHAARGIPLGVQPYPKKLRPQKSETETKTDSCHLWKGPGTRDPFGGYTQTNCVSVIEYNK